MVGLVRVMIGVKRMVNNDASDSRLLQSNMKQLKLDYRIRIYAKIYKNLIKTGNIINDGANWSMAA
jgi:hypothetical protein